MTEEIELSKDIQSVIDATIEAAIKVELSPAQELVVRVVLIEQLIRRFGSFGKVLLDVAKVDKDALDEIKELIDTLTYGAPYLGSLSFDCIQLANKLKTKSKEIK